MPDHFSAPSAPTARSILGRPASALIALALVLAFAWWAYSLAFTGTWYFDDLWNLKGLAKITDLPTALEFILSGRAGPTGRPLALLSFALQAGSWPDNITAFLRVNTLIHLFNGLLVFIISLQLAGLIRPNHPRRHWFAVAVAAAWTLSPFLASASLMVVQRMTTLSALFVFAGMAAYLHGRKQLNDHPQRGLLWMGTGAVLGTLLATLAKENGALLPALLLVVELTLLHHYTPISRPSTRRLLWLMLGLPTAVVVTYLLYKSADRSIFLDRPYTSVERVLTQCRILWDYVLNLLLPRQTAVTPFTDDWAHSTGLFAPMTTALGLQGLLAAAVIAWLSRKRIPVLTFAIVFFLAGHLIESTTLKLELYFGHRNYIPAFGLYFALCWAVFYAPALAAARKLAAGMLALWILLGAGVLIDTTSLWGQPYLAAEMWYLKHPASERAAQFLAGSYLSEGDSVGAAMVFEQTLELRPESAWLELNLLTLCSPLESEEAALIRWERAISETFALPAVSFQFADMLRGIAQRNISGECRFIDNVKLLDTMLELNKNQDKLINDYTRHHVLYTAAELADALGQHTQAAALLESAYDLHPSAENVIMIAHQLSLIANKGIPAAIQRIDRALANPPAKFNLRINYDRLLHQYRQQLLDEEPDSSTYNPPSNAAIAE